MIPESHKIIGKEIYNYIQDQHQITLDKQRLLWGTIAPDFLPRYKFISHYKEESIAYISTEILKLTLKLSNINDFNTINPVLKKDISKKIGIISHYLTDYTTHPHARRIRCITKKSAQEHLKYEMDLNEYLKKFDFKKHTLDLDENLFFHGNIVDFRYFIMERINEIMHEYHKKEIGFKNDIQFALKINLNILSILLETSSILDAEPQLQTV